MFYVNKCKYTYRKVLYKSIAIGRNVLYKSIGIGNTLRNSICIAYNFIGKWWY